MPVTELARDQREELEKTLQLLLAPFRQNDRVRPRSAWRRKVDWMLVICPSLPMPISVTTKSGTTGDWKAHPSSGTSVARRTFTFGST